MKAFLGPSNQNVFLPKKENPWNRSGCATDRIERLLKRIRDEGVTELILATNPTVLDIVSNDGQIAILDTSATAHMPDVLEMPYRPKVTLDHQAAGKEGPHRYRLGGITCLAGDVIGDYAFDRPLAIGDELVFHDMAHYTMVKTTCFNGVQHPAIVLRDESGGCSIVREFDYQDFISRLT
mgnify:CR=1 FL=1